MDNKIEFSSLKELYNRVKPALYSKSKELKRLGYLHISERDIWNYLVDHKWKEKTNLELHELISDILYVDNYDINEYVMKKLDKIKDKDESISEMESLI